MKNLILVLTLFTSTIILSQSWTFKSGNNAFDGNYRTASVIGAATDYPYNKPILVVNYFEKNNDINFYLDNSGYFSDSSLNTVLWVFNNEKEVIYESSVRILSDDGKTIFLREFKNKVNEQFISPLEFINKLKEASFVSVRVDGEFGDNDIRFSLKGSSKAINFVIPEKNMNSKIEKIKKERKLREAFEREKDSIKLQKEVLLKKLKKISTNKDLNIRRIDRDSFKGQKIKFLLDFDNKYGYQSFSKEAKGYTSLEYNEYKGRIATIIEVKKEESIVFTQHTFKLKMDDNQEVIFWKVSDYENLKSNIGFLSLLDKAKEKYLNKTFYYSGFRHSPNLDLDIKECEITKITFAEDDIKYSQLYGAFNVFFKINGEEKMENVEFSETYAPLEGYEYKHDKEKLFENIFYYLP